MATQSVLYGTTTAFTITLASNGDKVWQEATAISNTANKFLDVMISGKLTVGAAAANGDMYVMLGSFDGNNYSYPLTGTNAAVTPPNAAFLALDTLQYGQLVPETGLIFLQKVSMKGLAATTAVPLAALSISQAFQMGGLAVPISFSVVVANYQGQALDATAAHFAMYYTGINQTVA